MGIGALLSIGCKKLQTQCCGNVYQYKPETFNLPIWSFYSKDHGLHILAKYSQVNKLTC